MRPVLPPEVDEAVDEFLNEDVYPLDGDENSRNSNAINSNGVDDSNDTVFETGAVEDIADVSSAEDFFTVRMLQ